MHHKCDILGQIVIYKYITNGNFSLLRLLRRIV